MTALISLNNNNKKLFNLLMVCKCVTILNQRKVSYIFSTPGNKIKITAYNFLKFYSNFVLIDTFKYFLISQNTFGKTFKFQYFKPYMQFSLFKSINVQLTCKNILYEIFILCLILFILPESLEDGNMRGDSVGS